MHERQGDAGGGGEGRSGDRVEGQGCGGDAGRPARGARGDGGGGASRGGDGEVAVELGEGGGFSAQAGVQEGSEEEGGGGGEGGQVLLSEPLLLQSGLFLGLLLRVVTSEAKKPVVPEEVPSVLAGWVTTVLTTTLPAETVTLT